MAARFATEKGVEVLLDAMPTILEKYPKALFQFAGPYQNIIGEEAYFDRLKPGSMIYQKWKLAISGSFESGGNGEVLPEY